MKTFEKVKALIEERANLERRLQDTSDRDVVVFDHPDYTLRLIEINTTLSAIQSLFRGGK